MLIYPRLSAIADDGAAGLRPEVGAVSTMVTGETATVFRGLAEAFVQAGALGQVMMTVTVSNACPAGE